MADVTSEAFERQGPHTTDTTTGITSWFVQTGGIVHRLPAGAFIEGDIAIYLTSGAKLAMRGRFPRQRRFTHVFDLTRAVGYNTHARQLLTNWALQERAEIEQLVVVTPPSVPVLRMGVSTMMVAVRAGSVRMDVLDDFAEAVRRFALKPA